MYPLLARFHLFTLNHNCNAAAAAAAKLLQSCPTLCDPIDGTPPGPTVPGILQARTLEWVAISFALEVRSPQTRCHTAMLPPKAVRESCLLSS